MKICIIQNGFLRRQTGLAVKKANWTCFSSSCDNYLANIDVDDSIDCVNDAVTDAIFRTAEESIQMSKGTGKHKQAILGDDECDKVVKDRKKARRKCRNSYDPQDYIEIKSCGNKGY